MTPSLLMTIAFFILPKLTPIPPQYSGQTLTTRIKTNQKLLALTFDDGPDPIQTPKILNALKQHNAKATFFILGKNAERHPLILQRIVAEGHAIATHSYSHRISMSPEEADSENTRTAAIVFRYTGINPNLFRAPFGLTKSNLNKNAISRKWASFNWTVSAADTATTNPEVVYKNICFTPNPGEIILCHDIKPHTAQAIPKILDHLTKQGFQFVTLPELLNQPQ
jgi:peptidoglycan-N-acetylglucosamine deacetylase